MEITFKLFATLADYLPRELNGRTRTHNQLPVEVPDEATVQDVINQFHLPTPVLVNGVFIPRGARAARVLRPRDELAVWPPIAGG